MNIIEDGLGSGPPALCYFILVLENILSIFNTDYFVVATPLMVLDSHQQA